MDAGEIMQTGKAGERWARSGATHLGFAGLGMLRVGQGGCYDGNLKSVFFV